MVRTMVGFAGVAIVAMIALKMLGALFGFAISIIWTLCILAFWGFVIYLVIRIFSPSTADRIRSTVKGEKADTSKIQKTAQKLNNACIGCHDAFR